MYCPVGVKSYYSILQALPSPIQIAEFCVQNEIKTCCVTDINSLSGAVQIQKTFKDRGIKPIFGFTTTVLNDGELVQFRIIAKNYNGFKLLLKILNRQSKLINFDKTYIKLSDLLEYDTPDLVLVDLSKTHLITDVDSYYIEHSQYNDFQILLCIENKTILNKLQTNFSEKHIPTFGEVKQKFKKESIEWTQKFADECENYSIFQNPRLPKFSCPNGMDADSYLKELCREGWKKKIIPNVPQDQRNIYADRVKYELNVLSQANLANYFLIIQNIVNYAKNQGWCVGPARGSCAGSLVSYLINITEINPISYNLIFERFINPSRFGKDSSNLPDIDCDFEISKRENVINYIKNEYGHEKVAHICTFSRLMGRAVLKEVLRTHNIGTFEEINKISQLLPNEAAISDELEEMSQKGEKPSVVLWGLKNRQKDFKQYCELVSAGLVGEYAKYFEQAIRLEGVLRHTGKHAAGIVISPIPLVETCPIIYDKENHSMIGWEYEDAERCGLVKMDILGVAALDKIQYCRQLVQERDEVNGKN